MKPVLVSRVTDDIIEVLVDYQTVLLGAKAHNKIISFSRGAHSTTEEGLIGIIFTVDVSLEVTQVELTVKQFKEEHEYIFKV